MIGIIGIGMVGRAVEEGFSKCDKIIIDPIVKGNKIGEDMHACEAVFICVPTPAKLNGDLNPAIVIETIELLKDISYKGKVVVKSTIIWEDLEDYDVVFNPEFLSRATSLEDFINPEMVIFGGDTDKGVENIYRKYSDVDMSNVIHTDMKTASFIKYTMNTFYATKVTFMNEMEKIANDAGIDWENVTGALSIHPWMGANHFQVPGPDGKYGYGGPCLPKDTNAIANRFDNKLLKKVMELNNINRIR
jgi:UDPglucose 6-dehydrogenase